MMSEVLQTNIFFLITGIAVIVFTVLFSVVLYHTIKILKSVRRIIERVEEGSETIAADIQNIRTYIVERSFLSRFLGKMLDAPKAPTAKSGARKGESRKKPERKTGRTELKIKDEG